MEQIIISVAQRRAARIARRWRIGILLVLIALAVALCEGATNISAFVWRRGVPAAR
jgi:hypothetical protein